MAAPRQEDPNHASLGALLDSFNSSRPISIPAFLVEVRNQLSFLEYNTRCITDYSKQTNYDLIIENQIKLTKVYQQLCLSRFNHRRSQRANQDDIRCEENRLLLLNETIQLIAQNLCPRNKRRKSIYGNTATYGDKMISGKYDNDEDDSPDDIKRGFNILVKNRIKGLRQLKTERQALETKNQKALGEASTRDDPSSSGTMGVENPREASSNTLDKVREESKKRRGRGGCIIS
jgi:hypothetical protein